MKKLHGSLHIEYTSFDRRTFSPFSKKLDELAQFYCDIWTYDPNFNEFMVCPVCEKYFSEVQCRTITTCSGQGTHPETALVKAWIPDTVVEEIITVTRQYGDNFFGILATDTQTDKIVGFTWGYLECPEAITDRWGKEISEALGFQAATYYSELAVDPDKKYRQTGIGRELCSLLTMWMGSAYPELPSFLRTHQTSPARSLFESVGYTYFADDPQHGDGRIMMKVDQGKQLVP